MTYNRDMQEDKVLCSKRLTVGRVARNGARRGGVREVESARPAVAPKKAGWWRRTWRKLWRARHAVPRSHQIAGRFVLESVKTGRKPADWTADEMRSFAPNSRRTWRACSTRRKA